MNVKSISISGLILFIAISFWSCRDSYIHVQNQDFRIGAAHSAALGAYGIARFEGKNLFERDGLMPFDGVEIIEETTMNTEEKSKIEAELSADIKKIKSNVGASGTSESKIVVTYRLRSIASKQELVDRINRDKQNKIYKNFRSTKDARIITNVLVGYGHSSDQKLEGTTKFKVAPQQDIGNIAISTSGSSSKKLKYSDGTILGYTYDRACWISNGDGEWEIARLLTDNPTLMGDANCPDGQVVFPE